MHPLFDLSDEQEAQKLVLRWEIAKQDPWYFLKYFTFTFDEHDPAQAAKAFPIRAYARVLCRAYFELDLCFVEKSRQIRCTWEIAALLLWDAMFRFNRRNFMQSKKQLDANGILGRSTFIYEQLKNYPFPGLPEAKMTGEKAGTATLLEFPVNHSRLEAIPQGGDVLRSWVSSNIFADEIAHQEEAADGYRAAFPTIKGGGRFWAVGTPNGKVFNYQMMYGIDPRTGDRIGDHLIDSNRDYPDRNIVPKFTGDPNDPDQVERHRRLVEKFLLDMDDEKFNSIPLEELIANVPGMAYWKTANGVHCIRVHYSADPEKSPETAAGREWIANEKRGISQADWDREYEISYDTFEGRPVVSNWSLSIHVRRFDYDSDLPLRISMDFGTQVCVAAFGQFGNIPKFTAKRLRFIDEIVKINSNTPELADAILERIHVRYKRSWSNQNIILYCDPNGDQERETTADKSLNTSIKIVTAVLGMRPSSRKFGVPESTQLLETVFALVLPDQYPAVMVDERCEYLRKVWAGLHYPPAGKGKPGYYEKDGWLDHGGDAGRYMIANCFDQYDLAGRRPANQTIARTAIREKHTGRIVGWRDQSSIEREIRARRGRDVYISR